MNNKHCKILATKSIINKLIIKGGIYGYCAEFYEFDFDMASKLIFECSEQCNIKYARLFWGEKLVNDILQYKNKFQL